MKRNTHSNLLVWAGLVCAFLGLCGCMFYFGTDWINPREDLDAAAVGGMGGGGLVLTTGKSLIGSWVQVIGIALFPLLFLVVLVGPAIRRVIAMISVFAGLCYSWIGLTFVVPEFAIAISSKKYPPMLTGQSQYFGISGLLLVLGSLLILCWPGQAQRLQSATDRDGWIVVARGEDPTTAH